MLDFSVTFFITLINLIILFLILRKLLFKPVTKLMEDRTKKVNDNIVQAEKDRQNAKQLLEQYEKQLSSAEAEADTIIRSARAEAQTEALRIVEDGKAEAARLVETARSRLEMDRAAAMALFRAEAAALVVTAAGRVIKRELAGAEQLKYAAEALNEITGEAGGTA